MMPTKKEVSTQEVFVSIITITYNAEKVLERTIQSILGQTCKDFEYIVIDGASTDKTRDIIKQYEKKIHYWVSEPDGGIYDAMNKGIQVAKGKYLWFMNAGDVIYSPQTLADIYKHSAKDPDIFFGETMMLDVNLKPLGIRSEVTPLKLPQKLHWKSLQRGMVVCHQSFIARRSLGISYHGEEHPYSADIDWEIRCLKASSSTFHMDQILSAYLLGGFSKQHLKASLLDRFKILQKHYGIFTNLANHLLILLRFLKFRLSARKQK